PDAPSQHFVGYLDDQPATVGTLLLSPGMAGIFDVATPTRFRRQGFAGALTHAAMTMAQERGFHHACLQASSQGVGLYGKLGFTTIFTEREFIWRRA
ncbi:MAG: GNAT family N-acetyltransferase, partial [Caldilineaceae bacterium]|nr:GNAT family N-acetyltransferase [Caldilineaceae bacterium]